uniref:Uncharacterized protein n=1 Tax=Cyanoptyche gloeocystis TaxID=77922 RepID=A0A7S2NQS7_9EUKA|mmetsp:Transcript_596/g.1153  ORF Transcript_596/g.1153 Transcript_596/m.1153 type:complete len:298 (+) Transcript_596:194-1087(+)
MSSLRPPPRNSHICRLHVKTPFFSLIPLLLPCQTSPSLPPPPSPLSLFSLSLSLPRSPLPPSPSPCVAYPPLLFFPFSAVSLRPSPCYPRLLICCDTPAAHPAQPHKSYRHLHDHLVFPRSIPHHEPGASFLPYRSQRRLRSGKHRLFASPLLFVSHQSSCLCVRTSWFAATRSSNSPLHSLPSSPLHTYLTATCAHFQGRLSEHQPGSSRFRDPSLLSFLASRVGFFCLWKPSQRAIRTGLQVGGFHLNAGSLAALAALTLAHLSCSFTSATPTHALHHLPALPAVPPSSSSLRSL